MEPAENNSKYENFAMLGKSACLFEFLATVSLSLYFFCHAANWKKMEEKIGANLYDRSLFLLKANRFLRHFAPVVSTDVVQLSGFCLLENSPQFLKHERECRE